VLPQSLDVCKFSACNFLIKDRVRTVLACHPDGYKLSSQSKFAKEIQILLEL